MLIVMMFCIFGALASFIQGEVGIGISGLIIGSLFSPYGLPMIGTTVITFIELINYKIKAVVISSFLMPKKIAEFKAYPTLMKEYLKSEHSGIEPIISDERY